MAKVLVFSVQGGGGHLSASKAIRQYLSGEHEIQEVSLFREVFYYLDPVSILTFRRYTIDDFYNYALRHRLNHTIYGMSYIGFFVFLLVRKIAESLVYRCIKQKSPDVVISVVPVVNGVIARACNKFNVPFIIVPTDLDISWFAAQLSGKKTTFIFCLAFDKPLFWQEVRKHQITTQQTRMTGFPLRKEFFEPKNLPAIKKDFAIPADKKVVLLLMGAVGLEVISTYVQEIMLIDIPLHVVVCLGRNEQLRAQLTQLQLPTHIGMTIVGFTERIADLMAIAAVCISKSGSVSVVEAIYSNVPLLLDNTTMVKVPWERFNIDFIRDNHFGDVIGDVKNVNNLLKKYLLDDAYRKNVVNNIQLLHKEYFGTHIQQVVREVVGGKD